MTKFSIIVPIYNVELYLSKCIESVLCQSYSDFQLILVNDGSTDNSRVIAEEYRRADKRIIIIDKTNGGLSDARNAGVQKVKGNYVLFLDGDDSWHENLLYVISKEIDSSQPDIVIFGYESGFYNNSLLVESSKTKEEYSSINLSRGKTLEELENPSILGYAWNKAYEINLLRKHSLSFERGTSYIEDCLFNASAFKVAGRITIIPDVLYRYRQRSDTSLGKKFYPNMVKLDIKANTAFCSMLDSLNLPASYIEAFSKRNSLNRAIWTTVLIANSNDIDLGTKKRELNSIKQNLDSIGYLKPKNLRDYLYIFLLKRCPAWALIMIINLKERNIKRLISDIIPLPLKERLLYYLSRDKSFGETQNNKRRIFIMLAADYGNLGDIAITYAQKKFLKEKFPDYQIVVLPISKTYAALKNLRRSVSSEDIITIVGGGNMGDLYLDIERQRRFIIKKFPRNRIISFPQTIDFTDTPSGNRELQKTVSTYSRHDNLLLFAREEKSFEAMKRLFSLNKVFLAPDIVLSLSIRQESKSNLNSITLCLRGDKEASLNEKSRKNIVSQIERQGKSIQYYDTHISAPRLSEKEGLKELKKIWSAFQSSDTVITDRLHGMIFCAITETPCIAFDNINKKVSGVYDKWICGTNYVEVVSQSDIKELPSLIKDFTVQKRKKRKNLSKEFETMLKIINSL